jgi:hypothetical protein
MSKMHKSKINKDTSVIPKGDYCYNEKGNCPYWSMKKGLPKQENGYCDYLGQSDYERNEEKGDIKWSNKDGIVTTITKPHEIGISLLWDQVKECGENFYTEEEEKEFYEMQ